VTLTSGLEVTQDHSSWYHLKAWMRFPIHLLWRFQRLVLLIYCIVRWFPVSVFGLFLDDIFVVSASGFFQWLRPRPMIVCRSGMWVWRLIESSRPNIREVLRVFKGRSCGRSFSYLSSAWESVSWVFSPVHCGERVLVISLAGQSAGWDS